MNSILRNVLWLSLMLIGIIVISGCTKKDNLTGNNWSEVSTITISDITGVISGFSFPAETPATISGSEPKLLAGNQGEAFAISYVRFTGLPASSEIAEIDSCSISLNLLKRSALPRDPLKLQIFKVNKVWPDSLSEITEADLMQPHLAEYTVDDTISIVGKQVKLPLQLGNWESGADSTGWNLAIKAVNSGWVEISSSETDKGPQLYFKYKKTGSESFSTYDSEASKDSYVLNAPATETSAAWKLDNLGSGRMYVQFVPTNTLFKDNQGNTLTAQQIKQLTVNEAKLVLYVKENNYYNGASTFSIYPYNVLKDSISTPVPLVKADYELILYTDSSSGLVDGEYIEIDITPIIQAYTSGDKEPRGIMLQSLQERQNFGALEFYDCNSPTNKPFVKITYTPPYL